jgi:hypothetical protein
MRRNAIISIIALGIILIIGLSTIPAVMSDSGSDHARQTNIAPLAKPSSSGGGMSQYGYGPENMIDLNTANMHWVSTSGGGSTKYFQLTWSQKYTIGSIYVIQHGSWSNPGRRNLNGCLVQFWDGTQWVTDGILSNLYSNFKYDFVFQPTTDSIRLYNLKVTGSQSSNPCIYEWYVYEGEGGIAAEVGMEPQSLNLESNGNYVNFKVYGFPENPEYTPYDVDPTACTVGGVDADLKFGTVNDNKYIGKADRLLVEDAIGAPGEEVEVEIKGKTLDGKAFAGEALIKAL